MNRDAQSNWFIRARLKTRQLLLLATMDEEGNVRRAAEVIGMAQPAASKLLKDLEDMLGVSLFDRTPQGMRPTVYGEVMIRHARMVLSDLSHAYDEISSLRAGLAGEVRIGTIAVAGASIVARAVARIKRDYPRLRVSIQVETSNLLLPLLAQGELDIMIGRVLEGQAPVRHGRNYGLNHGLKYEPLGREPLCLVVRPGHPLLARDDLSLAALCGEPWILHPSGSVLRHRIDMLFASLGLAPPLNVVNTGSLPVIASLLEQSDMLAVLPTEIARQYEGYGVMQILPLVLCCELDNFGIITRFSQLPSPAATLVLDVLREIGLDASGLDAQGLASG
ncbi:LysR family transcriptional regulator [Robbsia sp. Bb-Pol-6]|uniref:LysR family transcriptional regulator n=1 Tax=Robbsia betulipollinis TaxID=2981849 RepID=A0ABT3ZNK7_9BURK|nr:LysR family transcriptional regulator [Robbsia betulipollinis]MCY0387530.1 LysR family transcriptional regulator [Robbsia betulipollinis]